LLGQVPLCGMFFPSKEDEEESDDETEKTPSREPDEVPENNGLRSMMATV